MFKWLINIVRRNVGQWLREKILISDRMSVVLTSGDKKRTIKK